MPYSALKSYYIFIMFFLSCTYAPVAAFAQLKPMDEDYTPPPMFGDVETPKAKKTITTNKPQYFKPPLPPKRPKSFQMSTQMLEHLKNKRSNIKNVAPPNIGTGINNDTGNDIRIMNAKDVFDSID